MFIQVNENQLAERFMRYVKVDTQSDPLSNTYPTTEKQKDLSRILVQELQGMGISDAHLDEHGYVYATIPSNSSKKNIPVICYCAHVDTAPDCSGTDVKPILHKNYDGAAIVLPDDNLQVLTLEAYPYLKNHIGADIITASGKTLLGSDDKAGVAEIMEFAYYVMTHPEINHGEIKLLFTPDEEVGKGTANVDLKKLGAQYGYTLDGGEAGDLEDETFSADAAHIIVNGVISHPGYAKGKMVNALKIAGEILAALPKNEFSPETTEKREGFVHPTRVDGIAEKATIEFIVRDFDTARLAQHQARLKSIAEKVLSNYPNCNMEFHVQEQYRNMKEILDQNPHVVTNAEEAIKRAGLSVRKEAIRGGTDGSRLSFMGLPCPNLFAGEQAIHSKLEWIGVKDMVKAVETLLHLSMIWEEKSE
ncbi:MAG: peptidase T [Sphingobacteriales bacterium]|nr:peptidase T [Sphingobacteriales bacterium]